MLAVLFNLCLFFNQARTHPKKAPEFPNSCHHPGSGLLRTQDSSASGDEPPIAGSVLNFEQSNVPGGMHYLACSHQNIFDL